jgi:hypothetical protein
VVDGCGDLRRWALINCYRCDVYIDRMAKSSVGHRDQHARRPPRQAGSALPGTISARRRSQLAAASCSREGFTKLSRFSLTKFGIQLFCVFRDKRVSCTQAADVLPGLRVEPTLVRIMTKVGLCRVPERTVIFDSLVLSSRHDTDVRLRHSATA